MFSLKEENKSIKIILAVSCILYFCFTVYTILKLGNSTLLGDLYKPDNDDVKFIRSAWTIVDTGVYVYHRPPNPTTFMMPGLPYTLAFFTLIFGKLSGLVAFRIFQALLQTLCLILVFLIGRKIFNSKVGIVAVFLELFYISELWVPNLILTETLFKFFVLLLVYFSIFAIEKKQLKYYILGGISWGLATLTRPTIALFPLVILIMWLLKKYSFKDILKYTLVVALTFSIVLSPWWIRNYSIFHEFIPLTEASGNPMLQGTYINYNRTGDTLDYSEFNYSNTLSERESNKVEIAISKYRLKNLVPKDPLGYAYWYTIGKAKHQILSPFYWIPIYDISTRSATIYHLILLVISLLGGILFFRNKQRNKMGTLLFLTIMYFIVVYLPFFAFSRYFYPAIPFVMIFAASFIVNLYLSFSNHRNVNTNKTLFPR